MDELVFKYRQRTVSAAQRIFIQQLIAAHPRASRRELSRQLCLAWNWVQPNGVLCDMVCRGLMLGMHRAGLITLPPVAFVPNNPLAVHRAPHLVEIERQPLQVRLAELQPLQINQVRRTGQEGLFNSLMHQHHYLGYARTVGEHLKYVVSARGQPIACLTWCSAARRLGIRDRYIGWSPAARLKNIALIAYNTRFLILPWVTVEHLASHVLGRVMRRLSADWQQVYGHPLYYLETFVDRERFRGTCYRAANWISLGRTEGRGVDAPTRAVTTSIKEVFGYPLARNFRERLGYVAAV
ncbi:MAG: Druantia anti-phage system protein DruA [Steroidobacteraceae bacterium]